MFKKKYLFLLLVFTIEASWPHLCNPCCIMKHVINYKKTALCSLLVLPLFYYIPQFIKKLHFSPPLSLKPDSLLTNPLVYLQNITDDQIEFTEKIAEELTNTISENSPTQEILSFLQKLEKSFAFYANKNPLFLSGECTSSFCPLSRHINPEYRQSFEEKIVDSLNKKIKASNSADNLHYVSFGSCATFPDILLLTKFLTQNPTAHITVSFIDLKNQFLTQAMGFFRGHAPYIPNNSPLLSLSLHAPAILHVIHTAGKTVDPKIYAHWFSEISTSFHTYLNALTWLRTHFPLAHLEFYVYENIEKFKASIPPKADVVAALDMKEYGFSNEKVEQDFEELCRYCLLKNPECNALSHYCKWPNLGENLQTFAEALQTDEQTLKKTLHPEIIAKEWKVQQNADKTLSLQAHELKLNQNKQSINDLLPIKNRIDEIRKKGASAPFFF